MLACMDKLQGRIAGMPRDAANFWAALPLRRWRAAQRRSGRARLRWASTGRPEWRRRPCMVSLAKVVM